MRPAVPSWGVGRWAGLLLALLLLLLPFVPGPVAASPGLCVGPVCGDEISRSAKHHWQLRLRVSDQESRRERIVVDCRDGGISPRQGPVDRTYSAAVARRCCRLVGEG
ncbi:hypothetical protein VB737_12570 [Synechococcus sp. BA-120 BA3]|nr:hypothetical protein [Synechococcus sp. BA-120 BA3]